MENALSGNTTSSRLRNLNTAFNSNIDDAAAITNALSNKTTKQAITSTLKDVGDDIFMVLELNGQKELKKLLII